MTGGDDSLIPGFALTIGATPRNKQRAMDAGAALAQLATVPPHVLVGTMTASLVQLADPVDVNTVLIHLRTAAAWPGRLLIYVAGQIGVDRKQKLPHLALGQSTSATLRYTALPWHLMAHELRNRLPGTTTVIADLIAADQLTWRQVTEDAGRVAARLPLYGVLAPPRPKRGAPAAPTYSHALVELIRNTGQRQNPAGRTPLSHLHQRAVAQAGLGRGGELLFAGIPDALRSAGAAVTPMAAGAAGAWTALALPGAASGAAAPGAPGASGASGASYAPGVAAPGGLGATRAMAAADPFAAIRQAAQAGRHSEAAAIAAMHEQAALRAHGPASPQVIQWIEVQADLAMMANDHPRACTLWLNSAQARLRTGQPADHEGVVRAVDRAHHCWARIEDRGTAIGISSTITEWRRRVPGRQADALERVQKRVEYLKAARTG